MLTVTMVRKADYSGYRLFITPEMEGYPTDENQAAAYIMKVALDKGTLKDYILAANDLTEDMLASLEK